MWTRKDDCLLALAFIAALWASPADAQSRAVADCANPGVTYSANQLGMPMTLDLSGRPCTDTLERDFYPVGSTPVTNSATGTTGAVTATLPAAVGKTTYLCGFNVRSNATAAVTGNITVTGTLGGTLNFTHWVAPAASGLGTSEPVFYPCIPASATNTALVVTSPAAGAGGVNSATAWGYQQ